MSKAQPENNASAIAQTPAETPQGTNPSPLAPVSLLQTVNKSVVLTGENRTEKVEVLNPVTLELECVWTGNDKRFPNTTGYWTKDGKTIEDSYSPVQLQSDRYHLKREFSIMSEENLGTYSCVFEHGAKMDFVLAVPYLGEVRDKPIISYVGDSVVMICKMDEKKSKPVSWNWYKENGTNKEQLDSDQDHRYKITKEEGGKTKLVVYNLTEADSGLYFCGAVYGIATSMGYMQLKVLTFYEPLKPFAGILIEVVILVTAILLYEKTGSKKKSQSENEGNAYQTATLSKGENAGEEVLQ